MQLKNTVLVLIAVLMFTGCFFNKMDKESLPLHDEVLVYPIAYDLAYLRAVEAVENVTDWELEETEKEKGIIRVRNTNYSRLDNAEERMAIVLVKRMDRRQTSIELAPESQRIIGGDDLMKRIGEYVSQEI